jgi:hypothetical protein
VQGTVEGKVRSDAGKEAVTSLDSASSSRSSTPVFFHAMASPTSAFPSFNADMM